MILFALEAFVDYVRSQGRRSYTILHSGAWGWVEPAGRRSFQPTADP